MNDKAPPKSVVRTARMLAWVLVGLALVGIAALFLIPRAQVATGQPPPSQVKFGGPFTLVGADGKPFSSQVLAGKPYAIYFGFTRCGDTCPTTLSRLARLRRQAANDAAMSILFVTIDPDHDGPKEVGQYATLFNAPIIGLTGSKAQIDRVKTQYGIYAEPVPHAAMGQEMAHTATVLLFDRQGRFAGTISPDEADAVATAKIRKLVS